MHALICANNKFFFILVNYLQGELQLNMHQQTYIAKTKEQEMVNAIIQLAKYGTKLTFNYSPLIQVLMLKIIAGERKYERKPKRKSLFQKVILLPYSSLYDE